MVTGFLHDSRLLLFMATVELSRWDRQRTRKLIVLIQLLFLNKCNWDSCKTFANFQSPGTLILIMFASVTFAFMEGRIFRGTYLAIPSDMTPMRVHLVH